MMNKLPTIEDHRQTFYDDTINIMRPMPTPPRWESMKEALVIASSLERTPTDMDAVHFWLDNLEDMYADEVRIIRQKLTTLAQDKPATEYDAVKHTLHAWKYELLDNRSQLEQQLDQLNTLTNGPKPQIQGLADRISKLNKELIAITKCLTLLNKVRNYNKSSGKCDTWAEFVQRLYEEPPKEPSPDKPREDFSMYDAVIMACKYRQTRDILTLTKEWAADYRKRGGQDQGASKALFHNTLRQLITEDNKGRII